MGKFQDLTGEKFGKWTVICRAPSRNGNTRWVCKCACGVSKQVNRKSLVSNESTSCGCGKSEKISKSRTVHGHSPRSGKPSTEYVSWNNMISRCTNNQNKVYAYYGGRGIKVCERWLSFSNFIEDMGRKPTHRHTIERIDVNGNYEPANCKWATMSEQVLNRRKYSNNKSGHRGVSWDRHNKKWSVNINVGGKRIKIDRYKQLEDAIEARKKAELQHWEKSS